MVNEPSAPSTAHNQSDDAKVAGVRNSKAILAATKRDNPKARKVLEMVRHERPEISRKICKVGIR